MIGDQCNVARLKTKHDNPSSSLVTCEYGLKNTVMNPEE